MSEPPPPVFESHIAQKRRESAPSIVLAQILHRLSAPGGLAPAKHGSRVWASIRQSTMRLPHRKSFICTTLGERKTFLLATASRGIGHPTGQLLSEERLASFESWMRRHHLNLPGLTFLPQDLFPEFRAASVVIIDMTRSAS
ncbi:hypothetical protein NLM23_01235 [Bradyrhizobium cajani]|nr:hypothetical protein [Bradyrhizobium cajani]